VDCGDRRLTVWPARLPADLFPGYPPICRPPPQIDRRPPQAQRQSLTVSQNFFQGGPSCDAGSSTRHTNRDN
jgi:hypothetical protein